MSSLKIQKFYLDQFCGGVIAANLDLATAKALTDLHQYINSDLVFSDLKFWALFTVIATVAVVIPSGMSLDLSKNCF